jgi:thioredoxin-like negative regulator of GroEL
MIMVFEKVGNEIFDAIKRKNILHVILIHDKGCGPCKKTIPEFEKVSVLYGKIEPKIQFYLYEAWGETNGEFSAQVKVEAVPTLVTFYNGKEISRERGAKDSLQLRSFITTTLETLTENHSVNL